jgi:hypothetical protein
VVGDKGESEQESMHTEGATSGPGASSDQEEYVENRRRGEIVERMYEPVESTSPLLQRSKVVFFIR